MSHSWEEQSLRSGIVYSLPYTCGLLASVISLKSVKGRKTRPEQRMLHFVLLINRQGKTRLAKWYSTYPNKDKTRIMREVSTMVLNRNARHCNVLEWKEQRIIFKRFPLKQFCEYLTTQ